jgi:N-glycosidase YbiA
MTIYFYKVDRPYGCFSNFSPHPIHLQAIDWPTVEHYYQAQKFIGTEFAHLVELIRWAPTPEAAAALGRSQQYHPRADWPEDKFRVMYIAVRAKFYGHPEPMAQLLATGQETIVEDSPVDYIWGCGADRSGQNHLGRILMRIRAEARA